LKTQQVFKNAGLSFGIVGALAFVVFVLIFGEDWMHRYRYLNYLLPLPVVTLLIAKRLPLPGGLLLIAAGGGAAVFDFFFSPGYPGQVAGRGLGYTLFFVAMPLVLSGFFYLILWWKSR
jgi:multisubunit Na+/H+ antiporter MnhB subunit